MVFSALEVFWLGSLVVWMYGGFVGCAFNMACMNRPTSFWKVTVALTKLAYMITPVIWMLPTIIDKIPSKAYG